MTSSYPATREKPSGFVLNGGAGHFRRIVFAARRQGGDPAAERANSGLARPRPTC
jgi:hypothetical protein